VEGYDATSELRQAAETRAIEEIEKAAGHALPPLFKSYFHGEDGCCGWYLTLSLFVTEELKTNERFRSIFMATEVLEARKAIAALDAQVKELLVAYPALEGVARDIRDGLDALTDTLTKQMPVRIEVPVAQSLTGLGRFSFRNTDIPFLGREDVFAALDGFLEADARFGWHLLTGEGGAGKSRLALELCGRLRRLGWSAGFALGKASGQGYRAGAMQDGWMPKRPTLVIIDYVLAEAEMTRHLLDDASRSARRDFAQPFRILLLDRREDQSLETAVISQASEREAIRMARWRPDALSGVAARLPLQTPEHLWEMARPFLGETSITQQAFLERHGTLDPERRALTALVLADALGRDPAGGFGSLADLLGELLLHERRMWPMALRNEGLEQAFLALATMAGGYATADHAVLPPALQGRLDNGLIEACASVAPPGPGQSGPGQTGPGQSVGRLSPDLIGEFMALQSVKQPDRVRGGALYPWLAETAWRMNNGGGMRDFLTRARRDFTGDPALDGLKRPVPGVAASFVLAFEDDVAVERQAMLFANTARLVAAPFERLMTQIADPGAAMAAAEVLIGLTGRTPPLINARRTRKALSSLETMAMGDARHAAVWEPWAESVFNFISDRAAEEPEPCRALLERLEARAAERGEPALWEQWAKSVTNFINRRATEEPDVCRAL
ncbi:MAG: hypothetical protein ACRC7C_08425, partial [Beijerinckiaceae bacterium]